MHVPLTGLVKSTGWKGELPLNRISSTNSNPRVTLDHADSLLPESTRFATLDGARTFVAGQNFPDKVQLCRFEDMLEEKIIHAQGGCVDVNGVNIHEDSLSILKQALIEARATLPTVTIRTEEDAIHYMRQHYRTKKELNEFTGSSLVIVPQNSVEIAHAADEETVRLLANASKRVYNLLPSTLRIPNRLSRFREGRSL